MAQFSATPNIYIDEWIAQANEEFAEKGYPRCHGLRATVVCKMVTKPIGTFSLSGNQDKLSSMQALTIECPDCGLKGILDYER